MTPADWHDITVAGCIVFIFAGVAFAAALVTGWGFGWFELSLAFKVIPPWRRKEKPPAGKKTPSAAEQPAAEAPVSVQSIKKAS